MKRRYERRRNLEKGVDSSGGSSSSSSSDEDSVRIAIFYICIWRDFILLCRSR